jgi:signal transduction histidine kinase
MLRALSKIIHNAVKFTNNGYVHITVQDVTREAALPTGYDNSIKLSTVSIDVKDSGVGSKSLLPYEADP